MKLGDAVKAVTSAVGIEQCDPCKQRQIALNNFGDRMAELFGKKPQEKKE